MTAAARQGDALDWRAANQAGFAFPTVDPMLQLKEPSFSIDINVVAHRRTAGSNCFPQDLLNSSMQFAQLLAR